jgi:hypothetical protein
MHSEPDAQYNPTIGFLFFSYILIGEKEKLAFNQKLSFYIYFKVT